MAAVVAFGRAAGAGFVRAWALAAAGLLAVGTGLGARLGGFPLGFGVGVLNEDVVVVPDDVVVVVEVMESEAEETAMGYGRGSWTAGVGVGCWGLRVMRTRVRVRAPGVCARFPWCPACVPVLVQVYVAVWWYCLGCAATWVNRGVSTSAPGLVGALVGGTRGY